MQTEAIFENIAERVQQEISKAEKSIFIAVACLTNKNIFNELLIKAKNFCNVSLIIYNDCINKNLSIDFEQLLVGKSRIYKLSNDDPELLNNKFCIIDYNTVITGSYNWGDNAEKHFENIIITKNDTNLAHQFVNKFNNIRKKYYPDFETNEDIFPLSKIIKRLEILKNYILLEDIEEINKEILKLKNYDFNYDLSEIINLVKNKEFSSAINKIQFFISKNQQLTVWSDPEIEALKLEIKNLENQINAYENEKIELEKLLSEFNHRHTIELGPLILEILRLKKLKYWSNKEKYEEADNYERQYREQFNAERKKEIFELTEDEKIELKKKFRRASFLCHPDKVSDEFREAAHKIFIELKQAFDVNDLKKVSEILEELEKGNLFKASYETANEKDLLKAVINKLKMRIKILETEIINIKESEIYKTIMSIDNWDEYFKETKEKLQREIEELKLEIQGQV